MKNFIHCFFYVLLLCVAQQPLRAQFSEKFASLNFTENKGQISDQFYQPRPDILFSGKGEGLSFYLKNNGISYQFNRTDRWEKLNAETCPSLRGGQLPREVPAQRTVYRIDVNWLQVAANVQVVKGEALSGFENYYGETCPQGALNVKKYAELVYKGIYPGIDLKWYGNKDGLKYDYYVGAGADYTQIQLEYKGADKIYVNAQGELIIETPLGRLTEEKPIVFQQGRKLEAAWQVQNNIVSFSIKDADKTQALVIDPLVRLWGTYFGGGGNDNAYIIETDNLGNVYLTGETQSSGNIATVGAHQTVFSGGNVSWEMPFLQNLILSAPWYGLLITGALRMILRITALWMRMETFFL